MPTMTHPFCQDIAVYGVEHINYYILDTISTCVTVHSFFSLGFPNIQYGFLHLSFDIQMYSRTFDKTVIHVSHIF